MTKKLLNISLLAGAIFFSNCAPSLPILEYLKSKNPSSFETIRTKEINGQKLFCVYFPACGSSDYLLESPPHPKTYDFRFAKSEMMSTNIIKKYLETHSCKELESVFANHDNGDHIITPKEFEDCGLYKLVSNSINNQ